MFIIEKTKIKSQNQEDYMGTLKQNYDLVISVDAGYDASKVTINGIIFDIPSDIVNITGKDEYIGNIRKENYIAVSYTPGLTHLVGEQARMLLSEEEYKLQQEPKKGILSSYEKFTTKESDIHLMTSIGMALVKYSEYTKKEKIKPEFNCTDVINADSLWKIFVIVGYPYDGYTDIFKSVKQSIVKRHQFVIETEKETYNLDFDIPSKHVMAYPQATAAYMGLISDDNGEIVDESEYLENLPSLLIDGGQKTMGEFKITKNFQIEAGESNKEYAMNNIYEKVVEKIKADYKRNDIETYNISEILKNEDGKITYIGDDDVSEILDVTKIVEEKREEICAAYIEHLNNKFNKLLDIKQIAIAGGTGAAFYEDIKTYVEKNRPHLKGKVKLANYRFLGKPINPVHAVTVGLYKILKHSINVMREKGELQ